MVEQGSATAADDDLTGVVTHLTRMATRGVGTRRNPNQDPRVRWFLDAGIELLSETFTYFQERDDDQAFLGANDFLAAIKDRAVMERFEVIALANGGTTGRNNKSRRRTLWTYVGEYHLDLLAYIFRTHFHDSRMAAMREGMASFADISLGELVDWLAVAETDQVTMAPEVKLQLALQASFPADPRIRRLAGRLYEHQMSQWAALYEEISGCSGMGLDSTHALDWHDAATIFNVVVEGSALRRQVDPSLGELNDGSHVAVTMIQILLSHLTGRAWNELRNVRADLTTISPV